MKFRKLTIENCKSFQFVTEIRFPVGEDGRSIFLIGGMKGAGRTSIMEAINYCLYGAKSDEIFRNINRREKARGNASVSFELVMEMDDLSELYQTTPQNITLYLKAIHQEGELDL